MVDLVWAVASPLLALCVRDAYILTADGAATTAVYCLVALAFSLVAFTVFGISDGVPDCFSVHDALDIGKAVGFAGLRHNRSGHAYRAYRAGQYSGAGTERLDRHDPNYVRGWKLFD